MGELPDCMLCLSTAVAQHCFPFISTCRTVRGPLDHGDAQWVQKQQLGRPHRHLHHLCGICSADASHPACHGGALSLSARLASALVGGVVFGRDQAVEQMATPAGVRQAVLVPMH